MSAFQQVPHFFLRVNNNYAFFREKRRGVQKNRSVSIFELVLPVLLTSKLVELCRHPGWVRQHLYPPVTWSQFYQCLLVTLTKNWALTSRKCTGSLPWRSTRGSWRRAWRQSPFGFGRPRLASRQNSRGEAGSPRGSHPEMERGQLTWRMTIQNAWIEARWNYGTF